MFKVWWCSVWGLGWSPHGFLDSANEVEGLDFVNTNPKRKTLDPEPETNNLQPKHGKSTLS